MTDFGYTSQRAESGFGLQDFNARYFSSKIGRFLTPDSIVPDYSNPQDLNRYAYVINNPLKFVDPDGHCRGLAGVAYNVCAKTVTALAPVVHKANEYRDDIFFPDENTTSMDRLEAAGVIGVGATLMAASAAGGLAFAGTETVAAVSTSSATALASSGAATGANLIGQAINKTGTGESINYEEAVIAGTTGYVAGALAPIGATTYAGAAALGGLSTTGQYAMTQLYNGDEITPGGVLYNSGVGTVFGGLAGPVPNGNSPFSTYANSAAIRQEAILDISRSQMMEIMRTSSLARALTSGIGTTLNWEKVQEEFHRLNESY